MNLLSKIYASCLGLGLFTVKSFLFSSHFPNSSIIKLSCLGVIIFLPLIPISFNRLAKVLGLMPYRAASSCFVYIGKECSFRRLGKKNVQT